MRFFLITALSLSLIGCNIDNSSNDSSCSTCIWDESSQTIAIGYRGGIGGVTDPVSVHFPDSGDSITYPNANSHTTDTGYSREDISPEALEYLKTVETTEETYMSEDCITDNTYDVIKVNVGSEGEETYYSNKLECSGNTYEEGRSYIPDSDMQALLALFPTQNTLPIDTDGIIVVPVDNIWPDSSQKIEIALWNNTASEFDTVLDRTQDTITDTFSSQLQQTIYSEATIQCTDNSTFPQSPHYQVTVTDETGLTKVYIDNIASCDLDKVNLIHTEDIEALLEQANQ